MAFKIFLDANFLLDLTLKRNAFSHVSKIMQSGINGEIELYTTPAVLHIVSYFLSKAHNAAISKKIIGVLLNDITIIDCSHATAVLAVNSNFEDIEDALQYYAALTHNLDYFITSDINLKKLSLPQLPVYSAKELQAMLP